MYCVIVGDIIRSKSLDPAKRMASTEIINRVLEYINNKYENNILARFGIVRGDGFEGILFSQQAAPKIIQEIIMLLFEEDVKVRISSVMGDLSVVSSERNQADGPAFYAALEKIEELRQNNNDHWFQVCMMTNSIAQPLVDGLLQLVSALTKGWTEKQTRIVWNMINCGNKQSLVGEKLDTSLSLIYKQLKAAQYDAYQAAWKGLEQYLTDLEEHTIIPQKANPSYTTYFSIACRKTEQGDYDAAIEFYLKSLELAKEQFGEANSNLVSIYNGLSNAYLGPLLNGNISPDRRNTLIQNVQESIDSALKCQSSLPKMRLEYARTIALQGDFYSAIWDLDSALKSYTEAIQIMEYCGSTEHPWIYECYNNIAIIYENQNKFDEALKYYQKNLEYAEHSRDRNPLYYAISLHNIGQFFETTNQHEDALKVLKQALEIFTTLLPAKDSRIIDTKNLIEDIMQTG